MRHDKRASAKSGDFRSIPGGAPFQHVGESGRTGRVSAPGCGTCRADRQSGATGRSAGPEAPVSLPAPGRGRSPPCHVFLDGNDPTRLCVIRVGLMPSSGRGFGSRRLPKPGRTRTARANARAPTGTRRRPSQPWTRFSYGTGRFRDTRTVPGSGPKTAGARRHRRLHVSEA